MGSFGRLALQWELCTDNETLRVSLKTKLSVADVHRLVCDVRRRVEYEVTFEGTERRVE